MRISVDYRTVYDYALPASGLIQLLRVEPHAHEDQTVLDWRVDVDADGSLRRTTDVFGNVVHTFYADQPVTRMAFTVAGEVETIDTHGIIRGSSEPLPPAVFLRHTTLSTPDKAIADFARGHAVPDRVETLHGLLLGLRAGMTFDTEATGTGTDAATAFAAARGVCQDYTHVFCAAARTLGIPARYVSGHYVRDETQPAGHAWAEAWVEELGWIGFDPTNGQSTTEAHLRVAVGLDYQDAAPVRGARRGGGSETMHVSVSAFDARREAGLQPSRSPEAGLQQ